MIMATAKSKMEGPKVVSQAEWLAARKELLSKEKEFTRLRDQLSRQRRELPWERVEKEYAFDGQNGKETLADLFGGKSQLIVYHFMFGPESEERPGASAFYKDGADNIFHTYSTYARGLDILIGAYNWLDLAPKGRDEDGLAYTMAWVRHHDKYSNSQLVDPTQTYSQPKSSD